MKSLQKTYKGKKIHYSKKGSAYILKKNKKTGKLRKNYITNLLFKKAGKNIDVSPKFICNKLQLEKIKILNLNNLKVEYIKKLFRNQYFIITYQEGDKNYKLNFKKTIGKGSAGKIQLYQYENIKVAVKIFDNFQIECLKEINRNNNLLNKIKLTTTPFYSTICNTINLYKRCITN